MALLELSYRLDEAGIEVMAGCAAKAFISEQEEAIKNAFDVIKVTIEYDETFGICRLIAVNNHLLEL